MQVTKPASSTRRLGVIGIAIAAIGIIVPIVWERVQTRTALELVLRGSITLVEADPSVEDLVVSYAGKEISTITKLDFSLANTGRTPIRRGDVFSPINIRLLGGALPLEMQVGSLEPANIDFEATINTQSGVVELQFPLLNPDDRVNFSILVDGPVDSVEAEARIAGISGINYIDARGDSAANPTRRRFSWTLLMVVVFTLLGIISLLGLSEQSGQDSEFRRLFYAGFLLWPAHGRPEDYRRFAEAFPSTMKARLARLRTLIAAMPEDENATDELDATLQEAAIAAAGKSSSMNTGCVLVFVAIGAAYITYKLFF